MREMSREEAITRLKCWLSNGTEGMTSDRAGYIEGWFVNADVRAFNMAIEALKEKRPHGECNQCRYYDGVHGVQGHAPCWHWNIGGVMWNDYCSRFEKAVNRNERID